MKKKQNPADPKVFEQARERLENAFPYPGIKKGFYVPDPQGASVFGKLIGRAVSSITGMIRGDAVDLRIYRQPTSPEPGVILKIDERRSINKPVIEVADPHQISDHHIPHGVPEDMMRQNNMTVEMVADGQGGLKVNAGRDGMVKVYINFPEPGLGPKK